ncbi:uracil-DNA glycosylase family protein [Jannaschia rubra]|uniref:Uracil DNA glycosylase superfamily protein n=1 Tax=Jannaschia rubra TaxID=282197 RepID=A0A0M6XPF4_9RHOB|nr:uracil-DNA glycosylase family protein [Jannaschia rubra]CTQ33030.1 Uracil DNA glycosylase superfamily protein [Jannaschia rubra]SFG58297.1 Uracil-DNA glycosylase [Jannaschia rubra]
MSDTTPIPDRIAACRLCADRFAATETAHAPAPVVWFRPGARVIVASQAPGMRAHNSGKPFDDPSGVRLREWMGVNDETFWNRDKVAIVPMGFCFPGYDRAGGDIPPPRLCAATWREAALAHVGPVRVTLLIGGYAQDWHLGRGRVTDRVRDWESLAPGIFCLPHPSWRNTAWLKKHPWFATDTLPALRAAIREALT